MEGDRLATCLAALPFPPIKVSDEPVRGMIFWTRGREAVKVDADAPETMLAPFFPGAEG